MPAGAAGLRRDLRGRARIQTPMTQQPPPWVQAARDQWTYRGTRRPPFAAIPRPGQESVWDFPRPPLLRRTDAHLVVRRRDIVLAETRRGFEVCETGHPPTYYFPREDVVIEHLAPAPGESFCEWKGEARYYDIVAGGHTLQRAAWTYVEPFAEFADIAGAIAFMPGELTCRVDDEPAVPQPGGFYGGWITARYAGPFKGEPGVSG